MRNSDCVTIYMRCAVTHVTVCAISPSHVCTIKEHNSFQLKKKIFFNS